MTRVLIAGSRNYPRLDLVRQYVRTLPQGTVVIEGECFGVDLVAKQEARRCGLAIRSFPADWKNDGRSAGFKRNARMVPEADRVVCFWDGKSRGTRHTMDLARAWSKPLLVFGPDGEEMSW